MESNSFWAPDVLSDTKSRKIRIPASVTTATAAATWGFTIWPPDLAMHWAVYTCTHLKPLICLQYNSGFFRCCLCTRELIHHVQASAPTATLVAAVAIFLASAIYLLRKPSSLLDNRLSTILACSPRSCWSPTQTRFLIAPTRKGLVHLSFPIVMFLCLNIHFLLRVDVCVSIFHSSTCTTGFNPS